MDLAPKGVRDKVLGAFFANNMSIGNSITGWKQSGRLYIIHMMSPDAMPEHAKNGIMTIAPRPDDPSAGFRRSFHYPFLIMSEAFPLTLRASTLRQEIILLGLPGQKPLTRTRLARFLEQETSLDAEARKAFVLMRRMHFETLFFLGKNNQCEFDDCQMQRLGELAKIFDAFLQSTAA